MTKTWGSFLWHKCLLPVAFLGFSQVSEPLFERRALCFPSCHRQADFAPKLCWGACPLWQCGTGHEMETSWGHHVTVCALFSFLGSLLRMISFIVF